jgi:hypothetical protein
MGLVTMLSIHARIPTPLRSTRDESPHSLRLYCVQLLQTLPAPKHKLDAQRRPPCAAFGLGSMALHPLLRAPP